MATKALDQSKVDQAEQTSQGLSCEQTLHVKQREWLSHTKRNLPENRLILKFSKQTQKCRKK